MAIAYDNKSQVGATADDTIDVSHAAAGSDLYAVIVVAALHGDVATRTFAVTYGGNACTQLEVENRTAGGKFLQTELWVYADPPAGASTVASAISGTGTTNTHSLAVVTFSGVSAHGDSSQATGNNAVPSVTVTTSGAAVVVGGFGVKEAGGVGGTPGTNVTERWDFETEGPNTGDDHNNMGGQKDAAGAGDHTFDYTLAADYHWCGVAVELQPVVAVGGSSVPVLAGHYRGMRQ